MSSSPTVPAAATATRRGHLLTVLSSVTDPRKRRGVRHCSVAILAVGLAAVLAGARSFVAVGEGVADQSADVLHELGVCGPARPDESTIRRLFARIDADLLDRAIGAYLWTRTTMVCGRRIIAIDGKTVRGPRCGEESAPHLVAALDHGAGAVIGQLAVAAKSNEIPCVRDLLATFDLADTVATLDAMHTQTATAEAITAAGGDYLLTIKNNTPAWIGFPGATQIAQLRRTVTKKGKKTVEVVYLLTSADHTTAPPAVLAEWIQHHWRIENKLHWVRSPGVGDLWCDVARSG